MSFTFTPTCKLKDALKSKRASEVVQSVKVHPGQLQLRNRAEQTPAETQFETG